MQVHVWNATRSSRVVTCAIRGPRDNGDVCINGAAAHRTKPVDLVIIAAVATLDEAEAARRNPAMVRVDEGNRIRATVARESPGPG